MSHKYLRIAAGLLIVLSFGLTACTAVSAREVTTTSQTEIPIFSKLTPLSASDAAAITTPMADAVKNLELNKDFKAYSTDSSLDEISTFYQNSFKDWTAVPAVKDPSGKTTTIKFTRPNGETVAVIYTANDPPATNFLVVIMHLWR